MSFINETFAGMAVLGAAVYLMHSQQTKPAEPSVTTKDPERPFTDVDVTRHRDVPRSYTHEVLRGRQVPITRTIRVPEARTFLEVDQQNY